ncbi:DUF1963 domain-containing protein [Streptomyces sp. AM 2-1-1]|uniref:DUF1963 domain-containing protein n=1 Tax=Streptomyces sp. AM 2-1-1 TaxID=3028709 RepID=UPI0023BA37B1|nr:DUF1963 domain-containing protein [Streptomyces sp. AM 2-1-1]WEH43203.1 DUF1963 domain-containing protein [Streptomyces sp. AM 2-1-1]
MTTETGDRFGPFREEADARGIPADDVERWLGMARPCVTLTRADEAGPVAGRFGGPLLLPAEIPDPGHPLVASVDLAALPAGATDLPLPPDGHLLFFALPDPDADHSMGQVVHVPAGAATVRRDPDAWNAARNAEDEALCASYPEGPLRAVPDVSLPYHQFVLLPGEQDAEYLPGHPLCSDLVEVWEDTEESIAQAGPFRIGGYADEEAVEFDPVDIAAEAAARAVAAGRFEGPVPADAADWVLLADWSSGRHVRGREGSTVHWVIPREDLAARRFERVFATVFWNP